jgi:hypothetical protein
MKRPTPSNPTVVHHYRPTRGTEGAVCAGLMLGFPQGELLRSIKSYFGRFSEGP